MGVFDQPERRAKSEYATSRIAALEEELASLPVFDGDRNMNYVRDTMRIHGAILGLRISDGSRNFYDLEMLANLCDGTSIIKKVLETDQRYTERIDLSRSLILSEESVCWFVAGFYDSVVSTQEHIRDLVAKRGKAIDPAETRPITLGDIAKFKKL